MEPALKKQKVEEEDSEEESEEIEVSSASDDDEPWETDEEDSMTKREYKVYTASVKKSDGFDVIFPFNPTGLLGGIRPYSKFELERNYDKLKKLVDYALGEYRVTKGEDLELVKLVKANAQLVEGFKYYFTLKAKPRGSNDASLIKTYQAEVYNGIEERDLLLFRQRVKK